MAERERSRDRPRAQPGSPHHAPSTSGSGGLFMGLFGGSKRATASVSRTSSGSGDKGRQVGKRDSLEELRSPKSLSPHLPPPLVSNDLRNRAPSPAPFDLQASLAALQPGAEENPARLVETINSTAAGLYNLHLATEDLFASQTPDTKPSIGLAEIRTLYIRAFAYSQSQLDSQTRTAAIRLLAVLIETHPPATMTGREAKANLPDSINPRSLYYLITAPTGPSPSISRSDANYVEVGALKALTKNGVEVEGLSGLVGWLSKVLGQIQDEWIAWCMQEGKPGFGTWAIDAAQAKASNAGRIKVASPGDAAVAIIDLLSAIISSHIALISPSDFDRIINTLINFTIVGINASVTAHSDTVLSSVILSRNSSLREPPHTATSLSSPTASTVTGEAFTGSSMTGSGLLLRSSSTLRRSREDRGTAESPPGRPGRQAGSPQHVTSPRAFPSSALGLRSPSPHALREKEPAKWSRVIPSLASIFDAVIDKSIVPKNLFKQIIAFVCFCFGQDEEEFVPESIWEALSDVCGLMLVRKGGWRGQELLREILEGKATLHVEQQTAHDQADRKLARGAVIASRFLCARIHHGHGENGQAALSLSSLAPSLRAALSTSRYPSSEDATKRTEWLPVDMEILALLQDNLIAIEEGSGGEATGTGAIDVWSEGTAACELLRGMLPIAGDAAVRGISSQRRSSESPDVLLARFISIFDEVVHLLPAAIGRLDMSSSNDPIFQHPKYIDLLLSLAPVLDEEYAATVIGYYKRECLCLPFTSGWVPNIEKLLQAFFFTAAELPQARSSVLNLIFGDVYNNAGEIAEKRTKLMNKVIVPFMDRALQQDQDEDFFKLTLRVLVDAAVAETLNADTEIRTWKRGLTPEEVDAEDFAAQPSDEVRDAASTGYFGRIREIIVRIATQTPCKSDGLPPAPRASMYGGTNLPPPAPTSSSSSHSGVDSPVPEKKPKGKESAGSALRGLMEALSPPSKSRDITPASSSLASPAVETENRSLEAAALSFATVPAPAEPTTTSPPSAPHAACKSSIAVTSLLTLFLHLTFAQNTTTLLSAYAAPTRCPSTIRCIAVFRDLLDLLYPMTDDGPQARDPNTPVKIPARCPKARLSILQLLVRLRADSRHQIYLFTELDKSALPYATILKRTLETEAEKRAELEITQRKASARQAARGEAAEDRGRPGRTSEPSNRSRSRSTQPLMIGSEPPANVALWHLPDQLGFTVPSGIITTGGIAVYDPTHPLIKNSMHPEIQAVQGTWLPTSQYIRALNGIFRGHDWELTSYILTFLPLQITNKLFFHGVMATKEIRSLLEVLCNGVLGIDPWERRYNLPAYIKRVDINAAAYHTLSILIAYRGLFSRAECDRLVQAFMMGLQGKGDVAKPCIQALAIAVFELEQSVSRNLLEIVRAMISILTTTGLAVHILEFLISLGQNGAIFRNFTDEQYRLVFRVAITYITEHNARSDQTIDLTDPSTREGYILSQHVIGLAYYAIYIWFMALRLPQRPNLVPEITRELLKGRSQRLKLDEMAEVCFDWLARYTYGNADPRPATSFLSEIVMEEDRGEKPKSQSWLLGGCIVAVTSHARTGWATITTTRPTGSTSVICKLENVPHLDLGEANADLVSLPAVLMANREDTKRVKEGEGEGESDEAKEGEDARATAGSAEYGNANPKEPGDDTDIPHVKDIVKVQSITQSSAANFDQSSQQGYIWSGATPSQRRKDVSVDPSYIAIQLLSSYPNVSIEAPRGRLIPNEDRFTRALRGIQNTPVIDTLKIAVLYVARGQTDEQQILTNTNGPQLYLDFLAGLGRLIRLKGQVDVFVGGLNRDNDSDGEYAYAWWDDLSQMIFHTPSMMPNTDDDPNRSRKKRLVGNDMIKIIYNNSGKEFAFDTIKTEYNWINIVISPICTPPGEDNIPVGVQKTGWRDPENGPWSGQGAAKQGETWLDWDREDWFKVTLQRADGIPDFSPIGTHKLVSKKTLPVLVRHMAHLANDMAARYVNVRDATDAAKAEYITSWRSRLRAMERLRQMLPPIELPPENDIEAREQIVRDFTRIFTYRPAPAKE